MVEVALVVLVFKHQRECFYTSVGDNLRLGFSRLYLQQKIVDEWFYIQLRFQIKRNVASYKQDVDRPYLCILDFSNEWGLDNALRESDQFRALHQIVAHHAEYED